MEWTREEMEALYVKMQKKAMTDQAFRKEILEDANRALEKLAGKELPKGVKVKVIEQDPAYTATFVLPDLAPEEMDVEELEKAAGGMGMGCLTDTPGCDLHFNACEAKGCFAFG